MAACLRASRCNSERPSVAPTVCGAEVKAYLRALEQSNRKSSVTQWHVGTAVPTDGCLQSHTFRKQNGSPWAYNRLLDLQEMRSYCNRARCFQNTKLFPMCVSGAVHMQTNLSGLGVSCGWGYGSGVLDTLGFDFPVLRVELAEWLCEISLCRKLALRVQKSRGGFLIQQLNLPVFPPPSDN